MFCWPGPLAGPQPGPAYTARDLDHLPGPISLGALAGLVTAGVAGIATLGLLTIDLNDVGLLSGCSGSSDPASFGGIRTLASASAVVSVLLGLGIGAGAGAIGGIVDLGPSHRDR